MMALLGFIAGVTTIGYSNSLAASLPVFGWLLSLLLLLFMITVLNTGRVRQYLISQAILHGMTKVAMLGLAFIFGAGYAHWQLNHALQQRLSQPVEQSAVVRVVGISDGVGEQWRQVVEPVVANREFNHKSNQPVKWLLYGPFDWNRQQPVTPPEMRPGQLWRVQV